MPITNAEQSSVTSPGNTIVTVDTIDHIRPPDDSRMEQFFGFSLSHPIAQHSHEQPPSYEEVNDLNGNFFMLLF